MTEEKSTAYPFEVEVTGDGSHTIFVPALNEHYHSVFGAINESRHIFIEAGLNFITQKSHKLNILEIGFGTGLNAILTYIEAEEKRLFIDYSSIELYPLKEEVYSKLNYPEFIYPNQYSIGTPTTKAVGSGLVTKYQSTALVVGDAKMTIFGEMIREVFIKMHSFDWNKKVHLSDQFSLKKIHASLDDYIPEEQYFNLVYFDAFGPDVHPEMWTVDVFKKMASALKPGGVLVTYSTKGVVKRNLKAVGFSIEKLPGPVGKREILRGSLRN